MVGGETWVLRPSFTALVAAEEELCSLFALVERAAGGGLTLREMAALFWHCCADRSDAPRPSREAVGEAIAGQGARLPSQRRFTARRKAMEGKEAGA